MMIVPTSRARREKERGEGRRAEEGRRRGLLTTGEWCDPVSKMSHHMKKVIE